MSLLSDKYAAAAKAKPQDVKYDTFTEHGLGDKYKSKKEPNHSAASEVKKLNKRLEKIDAPFYAVCKDDGTMGYRKVKPSCDADHPNVTYARKKSVDEALKEEAKEEKPAGKPSEKQDKPKKEPKAKPKPAEKEGELSMQEITDIVKQYGWTAEQENNGDTIIINRKEKKIIRIVQNGMKANIYNYDGDKTKLLSSNGNLKNGIQKVAEQYFYAKKESEKPKEDDRDAKSAKILEMIEAKFNKILESKG